MTAARTDTVLDEYGRPVPGAAVYVYNLDGTAATLTIDGSTPLTQPVLTDEFGTFTYWAADDYYREDIWFGGKLRYRQAGVAVGTVVDTLGDAVAAAALSEHNAGEFALSAGEALQALISQVGSISANPQLGPVFLEWYGGAGDGITDNAAALALAATSGCLIQLKAGQYNFSSLVMPGSTILAGEGRFATTIMITGDGGGAPSPGANGGIQWFVSRSGIRDCAISYNNSALQCLLNICPTAPAARGRNTLKRVDFLTALGDASVNAIAIHLGNQTGFEYDQGLVSGFKQAIFLGSLCNGSKVKGVQFQPNIDNTVAGVFWGRLPIIDFNNKPSQGLELDSCGFEIGPNGIKASGLGNLAIHGCYLGDGVNSKNGTGWLPSQAIGVDKYIFPSASVTGNTTNGSFDVASVSSTANLYVGQKVNLPGAGASGALLTARITAISGSTVTLSSKPLATISGATIYYPNYSGHGYKCTVAGTTGTSPPTWPTAAGGTVVDGTVTWMEYGPCAWIDVSTVGGLAGKNGIDISGNSILNGIVGVFGQALTVADGPSAPVTLTGNSFLLNDYAGRFDGISVVAVGNQFSGYSALGIEIATGQYSTYANTFIGNTTVNVSNPADFVITRTSGVGGVHMGVTTLTGPGAGKLTSLDAFGKTMALPGALSFLPAASATPTSTGQATFELTSDTSFKIKVKGSDGTVRSTTLTLS